MDEYEHLPEFNNVWRSTGSNGILNIKNSTNTYNLALYPSVIAGNITVYFPATGGTLELTSHTHTGVYEPAFGFSTYFDLAVKQASTPTFANVTLTGIVYEDGILSTDDTGLLKHLTTTNSLIGLSATSVHDAIAYGAAGTILAGGGATTAPSFTATPSVSSLTLTGATGNTLVVDTNTLVVDATNNRVGIGTASPSYDLDIQSATSHAILRVYTTGATADKYGAFIATGAGTYGRSRILMYGGHTSSFDTSVSDGATMLEMNGGYGQTNPLIYRFLTSYGNSWMKLVVGNNKSGSSIDNVMVWNNLGYIGIGVNPSYKFDLYQTMTDTSAGAKIGANFKIQLSNTSDSSSEFRVLNLENYINSSYNIATAEAGFFINRWMGSGGITGSLAGAYYAGFYGSTATNFGTIANVYGGIFSAVTHWTNNPTGTITTAASILAKNQGRGGAGITITNSRGVEIEVQTLGTNNTNLLIGTGTTGNWSIYNNSTYDNYFAGNIQIVDKNLILGTTTGTKIGTATNQKLSFFNATPVVQQTGCATPTDLATCITAITALRTALNNFGLTTIV